MIMLLLTSLVSVDAPSAGQYNAAPATRQAFLHYLPKSGFPLSKLVMDYRARKPKKMILEDLMWRQEGYPGNAPPPFGILTPLWRIEAVAFPLDFTAHYIERYFVYVTNRLQNQTWLFEGPRTDTPELVSPGRVDDLLGSAKYELWYPRYDYVVNTGYFVKLRGRVYRSGQLLLR